MIFRGIEIRPEWICSVIPHSRSIVVRTKLLILHEIGSRSRGHLVIIKLDSEKELQTAKFEHIQHIKGRPNPDERFADFECRDDDGGFSLKKMDRLIEMRKTRDEKRQEMQDEVELMEKMKKAGIPYYGPLMEMIK